MAVIAVMARIDCSLRPQIERQLRQCDGVSLVEVDQRDRLGVVIEKDTIAEAEAVLYDRIEATQGVLGAWPVFAHYGDAQRADGSSFIGERS